MFPSAFKEALDSMPFSVQAAVSLAFLFAITVVVMGAVRWARSKESSKPNQDFALSAMGLMDMQPIKDLAHAMGSLVSKTAECAEALKGIQQLMEEKDERDSRAHADQRLLNAVEKMLDDRLKQAGEAVKGVARAGGKRLLSE